MRLEVEDKNITWMGGLKNKPEGFMIPTHLKVLTIEEKPFVYVRKISMQEGEHCAPNEILCPHFNESNGENSELINDY